MEDHDFDYLLVAAIDFGTTYSGYAFSLTGSKDADGNRKIYMNTNWGGNVGCEMYKAPTCLLLNAEGEFDSFGFEAEEQYSMYVQERKENAYMFFKNFKMKLHKQHTDIKPDMMLKATNGKEYPAIKIFSQSLHYLSDHVLKRIQKTRGDSIPEDSIRWVITVPAIWNDAAKQFMRKAAYEAGLTSAETPERLVIALEPEAASIFCAQVGNERGATSPDPTGMSVGTKYMIVDCGGGTIDVTAHELMEGGFINELHQPTGGPWGGDRVNENFVNLLNQIFGESIMKEYKDSYPMEWNDILRDFERKKRMPKAIHVSLRFILPNMITEKSKSTIQEVIKKSGAENVRFSNGMLVIELPLVKKMFKSIIDDIINHLKRLLCSPKLTDVTRMLVVGGFSEAPLLQERLREEFESESMRIVVPEEAGLSIVKGAVEYGFSPNLVQVRVPALSYGVRTMAEFDESKHPQKKRILVGGKPMCTDVFDKFVEAGTPVKVRERKSLFFRAVYDNQTQATVYLFSTVQSDALWTTDEGMILCGEVRVEMPDTSGGKDRTIEVSFTFGGTEIEVEARDVTSGRKNRTSIDFHSK